MREEYEDLLRYLEKKYQLFINSKKAVSYNRHCGGKQIVDKSDNQIQVYQISNFSVGVNKENSDQNEHNNRNNEESKRQEPVNNGECPLSPYNQDNRSSLFNTPMKPIYHFSNGNTDHLHNNYDEYQQFIYYPDASDAYQMESIAFMYQEQPK